MRRDRQTGNRTALLLAIGAGVVALLSVPRAAGQNNSLLRGSAGQPHGGAGPAPATQPAGGMGGMPLPGAIPVAQSPGALDGPPPRNPVLLATSPIAIAPPEPRLIKVHDQITVIVREEKRAMTDAKLKSEKKWEMEAELRKWFRLNPEDHLVAQEFDPTPGADFDFDNKYEGKGRVDRADSLTFRITATVIDVKPNGNIVLEAKNTVRVDEETTIITLTGTCRTDDVTPQNTVLSTQLADGHIDVQHTGAARDAARRGWLMRLFDFIRPL